MGCAGSREKGTESKKIRKPKAWKHSEPITREQLTQMREEFWDTAPHYGGRKEIWDALRAAAEADSTLAQVIVDSAGVIIQNPDLTICYDERGAKYELPKYVLSEPTNMVHEN
ncbi:ubiquitin domain-containing protein 1-like [Salvia splendens]|uniref:ubiquitin domain-containing protein 1-like n=1 Tax=Salvia splendens TaxID=180675 RepID=UPI001C277E83|nr:ubiquitin domain-containing protein 1-like [Salvia splendens]